MIYSLGPPTAHYHFLPLLLSLTLLVAALGYARYKSQHPDTNRKRRKRSSNRAPSSAMQAAQVAAAAHPAPWAAYGGAHFMGTGVYTAETPAEAAQLYADVRAVAMATPAEAAAIRSAPAYNGGAGDL